MMEDLPGLSYEKKEKERKKKRKLNNDNQILNLVQPSL
jgi:hypothetical protein